ANLLGISLNELENLIKKKIEQYYGYINENTAIMIILKEKGIDPSKIYELKIIDLTYKMKVNKIIVKIGKIFLKKDNIIIVEIYDDTGKAKLIFKGDCKKVENLFKEENILEIRNGIVLKNLTLALYINNPILIKLVNNEEIISKFQNIDKNNLKYVTEFWGKVIEKNEDVYEVLTEKFGIVYIKTNESLEKNKNYIFKCYLKRKLDLINYKPINLANSSGE
ncbi:MAG: hypothetical protein QW184_01390, partial [Nanopusillaceae archaeon]